jgi:zinc-binding alcohol dehydrogenase family protein
MKAISFTQHALPIDNPQALIDISHPRPTPGPRDLLVEVRAVSVNPVDTKVRAGTFTKEPKILGWDATGIVREVGAEVTLFQPGDEVFYAGSIARTGSYSEFHLVDERIVGHKPHSLSAADAAALPLTSITAWELLFDRLGVVEGTGEGKCLLITGAAGGVGSMLVQLARKLTRLTVIGTASRQETADWVRQLGAHHVIDHSQPLLAQLQALGVPEIDYVASLTHTEQHFAQGVDRPTQWQTLAVAVCRRPELQPPATGADLRRRRYRVGGNSVRRVLWPDPVLPGQPLRPQRQVDKGAGRPCPATLGLVHLPPTAGARTTSSAPSVRSSD